MGVLRITSDTLSYSWVFCHFVFNSQCPGVDFQQGFCSGSDRNRQKRPAGFYHRQYTEFVAWRERPVHGSVSGWSGGGSSCTFAIDVMGIASGVQDNVSGDLTSTQSNTEAAVDSINAIHTPPLFSKAFSTGCISSGTDYHQSPFKATGRYTHRPL